MNNTIQAIPNPGVIRLPVAIRGRLIHTELGFLTGPLIDPSTGRRFNQFESLKGRAFCTTPLIGFGAPLEDEDHAFYDRPRGKEIDVFMELFHRALPPA